MSRHHSELRRAIAAATSSGLVDAAAGIHPLLKVDECCIRNDGFHLLKMMDFVFKIMIYMQTDSCGRGRSLAAKSLCSC